jgi:Fic family protein
MALSIHSAEELSKLPFLEEINSLKKEVDSYKPLEKDIEERILQKFRLDWNYHSNAIEGNKLTYGETVAFLMEGITAKAKPLKDHLDIEGHDEAVKYLIELVKDKDYLLTEIDIRNLHKIILKKPYKVNTKTSDGIPTKKEIKIGEYKSTPNHVETPTGETHFYATPQETPIKMGELIEWYKAAKKDSLIHPIVLASLFHHEFVAIHPFDDGNGRMARLLMNLLLMQEGYPPIVIKKDTRENYYQVLRQADAGELIPITEYMSDLMKHSLNIYSKGAKGESIEEEDDIDKEIALFKKGLSEDLIEYKKNETLVERAIKETIAPFFNGLFFKLNQFEDLFIETKRTFQLNNSTEILDNDSFENVDALFLPNMNKKILVEAQKSNSIISIAYYDIPYFNVFISFEGYKKKKIPFNIDMSYQIHFQDFEYYIVRQQSNHKTILRENYGQNISKEDLTKIIKEEVSWFMNEVKEYSK